MRIPGRAHVTVVDEKSGTPCRDFCVSRPVMLLLLGVFAVLALVVVLMALEVASHRDQTATIRKLEQQLADAQLDALSAHVAKAELEQSRRLQQHLLEMLGVPKPDSSVSDIADTVAGLPASRPRVPSTAAAAGAEIPNRPPSRWPTAGVIVEGFTRGDEANDIEQHLGVDIAGVADQPVYSVAEGIVEFIGNDDVLGNHVEIRHGPDWLTIYGHCNRILVGPGMHVRAGEQVAKMGRTGRATSTQLHFEVWQQGEAVDPRKLIAGDPAPR